LNRTDERRWCVGCLLSPPTQLAEIPPNWASFVGYGASRKKGPYQLLIIYPPPLFLFLRENLKYSFSILPIMITTTDVIDRYAEYMDALTDLVNDVGIETAKKMISSANVDEDIKNYILIDLNRLSKAMSLINVLSEAIGGEKFVQ
jgi:hypothetical protein